MAINAKKAKLYNSRNIKTQINDSSFEQKERLNIPDFLQSRQFEIRSFELSQLKTKNASATRVFQSLPRGLRRRAASHNVKRIPKRLRNRALREMKNSINGVPPKKEHLRGRQLYRLRMSKKLLKLASRLKALRSVPGEEFYGKKLNLRHKIKNLNQEIKAIEANSSVSESSPQDSEAENSHKGLKKLVTLNNNVGSYDNTGINGFAAKPRGNIKFHKRQYEFTWLPTHIWHSKRFHMIKQYGFQIPLTPTQKSFKLMNRQKRTGTIIHDTSYLNTLIWETKDTEEHSKLLSYVSKFTKKVPASILNGSKTYNDWIYIENRRLGKGLIHSNASLRKILIRVHPSFYRELFEHLKSVFPETTIQDCSYSLGSLDLVGPTSVNSISKVLHLFKDQSKELHDLWSRISRVNDSRIIPVGTTFAFDIKDPRFWKKPVQVPEAKDDNGDNSVSANDLIILLSQWRSDSINMDSLSSLFDPKSRSKSYENQFSIKTISQKFGIVRDSSNSINVKDHDNNRIPILFSKVSSFSWSIILPWYWVLPLWIKLIGVRNIKVGGIKQSQQAHFDEDIPNFPQDYTYLTEGWKYNELVGKITEEKYGKLSTNLQNKARPDFTDEDRALISPFHCDWAGLRNLIFLKRLSKMSNSELASAKPDFGSFDEMFLIRNIRSYNDLIQLGKSSHFKQTVRKISIELYEKSNEVHKQYMDGSLKSDGLNDIKSYKLPVIQVSLETVKDGIIKDGARIYHREHKEQDYKESSLVYLAGFVSSGAFNLNKGKYTGIGLVSSDLIGEEEVLVRNLGSTKLYRASIKHVS